MDAVTLAHFGDKLAVCSVGVGDKPVIHLADTQHFLDHLAGITLAQLYLFGKEFGAANFYSVWVTHSSSSISKRLARAFSSASGEPTCASIIS